MDEFPQQCKDAGLGTGNCYTNFEKTYRIHTFTNTLKLILAKKYSAV
jgi:hypothetical protein